MFFKRIFLCLGLVVGLVTALQLCVVAESLAGKDETVRISVSKSAPRMKLLGHEFVLIEHASARNKLEKYHSAWQTIRQNYGESIFHGENIPLPKQHQEQWRSLVRITKNEKSTKTLRNINGFFNSIASQKDEDAYGISEHWASPEEFLSRRSGDCEDYAITKFFALKYFKWPSEHLWIVFLHDNINKGGHAVLAAKVGKKIFILDNLSKPVYLLIPAEQYEKQVTPFMLANDEGLWVKVSEK